MAANIEKRRHLRSNPRCINIDLDHPTHSTGSAHNPQTLKSLERKRELKRKRKRKLKQHYNMKPTTARPVSSLGSLWLPMLLCLDTLLIKLQVNCDSAVQSSSRTQALPNQLDSTQLQEPLVWNSNSLYDSSLASASYQSSGHTKRVRRSPTGSEQVHPALPALVDACQSKLEVITPLYATNAKGKLRTVVNSELMQQAIQVETCLR